MKGERIFPRNKKIIQIKYVLLFIIVLTMNSKMLYMRNLGNKCSCSFDKSLLSTSSRGSRNGGEVLVLVKEEYDT